jgi:hypothetical protein
MQWNDILSHSVGRNAMIQFANGDLNCEEVQKVFRAGKDRAMSGAVRSLIRNNGTAEARKRTRTALKRRKII